MNKVSVISTTFNRSLQLRRGIFTLLNQPTSVPYEVIIVDDGSVDNTKKVVGLLAVIGKKRGVKVRYIYLHHPQPRICSYPKNVGIRAARGNILLFCEPEMLHVGRTLDQLVSRIKESPSDVFVATQIWSIGELIYKSLSEEYFIEPQKILDHDNAQFVTGPSMTNTKATTPWAISGHRRTFGGWFFGCLKKDMIAVGGWDEDFEGYGFDDFDLFDRFKLYGRKPVWCEDIVVIHQWHMRNYPFDVHAAADINRLKSMARTRRGEFRANIGKEWGKI